MKKKIILGMVIIVIIILAIFKIRTNIESQEAKNSLYEQQILNEIENIKNSNKNISEKNLNEYIETVKDEKEYDLTPLLTVIATCSATIVSILGGFVSSRLINITDEKNKIVNKMKRIKDEINLKKETIDGYKEQVKVSYAYEFLLDHLEDFLEGKELKTIFDIDEINIEEMKLYWDNAYKILKIVVDCDFEKEKILSLLKKEKNYDYRKRNLVEAIIEEIDYRNQNEKIYLVKTVKSYKFWSVSEVKDRNEKEVFIERGMMDISWLEIELKNLNIEKENLKDITPEVKGLKIFIILLVTILINMILLINPYIYDNFQYTAICSINIILFILGVIVIIDYLYKGLHNDDNNIEK